MNFDYLLFGVLLSYLLIVTLMGMFIGRKVKTKSDYAIGGRSLPGWAAALSERATGESAWALLGLPGAAYATGLTELWTALGCVAGIILSWIFISVKIRREAEKYQVDSFVQYIVQKHGDVGRFIQIFGSLVIAIFFFFYVGAQFIGGGKTMNQMFGFDVNLGIIFVMLFVVPYTIYGGFKSVVYTDVVQALLMLLTLIVAPIVGFYYISTNPDVFASSIGEALAKSGEKYYSLTGISKGFAAGTVIVTGFSWMFGYLGGMPQLTTRYMSTKNEEHAKYARNIGIIWTILAYTGALMLGWIGLAMFGPETLADRERVMPEVVLTIFPKLIAAILLTGVFAAMISTANSLLILSATEVYENIIKSKVSSKQLFFSRIVTTVLSLAALIFALIAKDNLIYNIVKYVWAGIGGTFSVIIILTLYWEKFNSKAVVATLIVGIVFTVIWLQLGLEKYASCLFLTFFVSLLTAIISTFIFEKTS